MKHRLERVNELMRRELGELINREVSFQAVLVTVQQVDITADLKSAHVHVSVMGTPEQAREALARLHANRKNLQHLLSKRVVLKFTPHLHFHLDESIERGNRIVDLLGQIEIPPDDPVELPPTDES